MFNNRVIAVIKRELREKLLSKTFILMTLLIPIFLFGILAFQTYLYTSGGNEKANLEIVSQSPEITKALQSSFSKSKLMKKGDIRVSCLTQSKNEFLNLLTSSKKNILNDKLTGIIFIPDSAIQNKQLEYYSKNPNNNSLFSKLKDPINRALIDLHFSGKQLSESEINFARTGVDFNGFRVSKDEKIKEEGAGNSIVSFLFTFLLYFSLLFLGTMMMRSVVQEKNNRIVEVLLSSVNSNELMTGKILGTGITGLLQMAIWLLPLFVVISSSYFMLPKDYMPDMTIGEIFYFLFNYFVGLITFLGLFASVGAIFDNDQDAQSGIWPITLLIMIPFFIAISMVSNPENQIAKIASMFPFASIIVMPARLVLVEIPTWQFAVSIIVSLGTMIAIFPIAGKIYRVGVLRTGKKPQWSEVIKWLKYKY